MKNFIKELEIGEIHLRDKWQFELKSEFFPLPKLKKNIYKQEFYFFIPNALQINRDTYTLKQYYRDQTNLIRYKTPEFTIDEILNPNNTKSPLCRISKLSTLPPSEDTLQEIEDELKLLGNIARSSIRERVRVIVNELAAIHTQDTIQQIHTLCNDIKRFRKTFYDIEKEILNSITDSPLESHFYYIDDFISNSINFYLTGLLDQIRKSHLKDNKEVNEELKSLVAKEKHHREEKLQEPKEIDEESIDSEYILYRSGLLNKYVLDALLLNTTRSMVYKKYRNIIGAITAGIAMLFFFVLFVWQGEVFIINSLPFILITVILYILKDRIKEELRNISYKQFHRWFPDYRTDIRSPDDRFSLGSMKESFSFVYEKELPGEIIKIRNREFHAVLEKFKRPERVIYYKKTVTMYQKPTDIDTRRHALNIIFRFNINHFLSKADNPIQTYTTIDSETGEFIKKQLPKVYHLNIILKNTFLNEDLQEDVELKKFRLVLDKTGVKRLEDVK